jgi:hypothetical protein
MSTTYDKYVPVNTIQLPTKHKNKKTEPIPISANNYPRFEIRPSVGKFDPNMASSPPNVFVNALKHRMDTYYTSTIEINDENKRQRAYSFEHMLRSIHI